MGRVEAAPPGCYQRPLVTVQLAATQDIVKKGSVRCGPCPVCAQGRGGDYALRLCLGGCWPRVTVGGKRRRTVGLCYLRDAVWQTLKKYLQAVREDSSHLLAGGDWEPQGSSRFLWGRRTLVTGVIDQHEALTSPLSTVSALCVILLWGRQVHVSLTLQV